MVLAIVAAIVFIGVDLLENKWYRALVLYMAHVGDCEGVFFADGFIPDSLTKEEWEAVIEQAIKH